jgi:serine/threonine-protein kinase
MTNHGSDDPLATGGAFDLLSEVQSGEKDPLLGRQLGEYEVIDLVAEGGMGRVYRARRADGSFEREVAIKVSAGANMNSELRSRFVQEQGVLASLNHPNICQLYDAQVSDEGWPYIVMEYVPGESIVSYCEKQGLDVRARVRLLVDIVDAVAYAHSRLVVHRDIKPANVLVNETGQARLVDFGIAKLLEPDADLTKGAPLTPRYASPEQLLGQPITVASDVAQLGLLIYEVLVGEPLNPSETLADAIQRAADGRSLRVTLDQGDSLPREILPIVEQCLRADPNDRYRDANSLKADLKAYLEGYPVAAVGQSLGYRLRKFLGRNLPTTITAAVALGAIVTGVSWYTWQLGVARDDAQRQAAAAQLQAEKSDQISRFLVTLFSAGAPENALGEEVTALQVLDSGVDKIRLELAGQDRLQAELLVTLGSAYSAIGEYEKATPLLDQGLELYRQTAADEPAQLARALREYAQHKNEIGELDALTTTLEEALVVARTSVTINARKVEAEILNALGQAYSRKNLFDESERYYTNAIELYTELYGAEHIETTVPLSNYANILRVRGRYEESLEMLESVYRIAVEELGPYHPWIAPRAVSLGRTYSMFQRFDEAEELLQVAVEQDRHLYGDSHQNVANSLQNLGVFVYKHRDKEEGVGLIEEGLAIEEQSLGDSHVYTNQTRTLLANYYNAAGRFSESEALLEHALPRLEATLDGDHVYLADMYWYFGDLYIGTDRPQRAIEALETAVRMIERLYGKESGRMGGMLTRLSIAYTAMGRHGDAYRAYARVVRMWEVSSGAQDYHYEGLEGLRQAAEEAGQPID